MQEARKVKSQKIKEMQEARELKIMATDKSNMTAERQKYFVEEVARTIKERKQRVMDAETQE